MPGPLLELKFFARFSLRHFRKQWLRTLAVILGVAMGAAVFASVRLAMEASTQSMTQGMQLVAGNADQTVTGQGEQISAELTARLLAHPGVDTAVPVLERITPVQDKSSSSIRLRGTEPILESRLRREGPAALNLDMTTLNALMTRPWSLLLGKGAAEQLDLGPGQEISLLGPHGIREFFILDLLPEQGLGRLDSGFLAITDIATMQEFLADSRQDLDQGGFADRIDILLQKGPQQQNRARILAELEQLLPAGVSLGDPGQRRESVMMLIKAYQESLTLMSFVSLFVGMFLIYSLVALNAASRRREVAIIRALGGSSRLPLGIFLGEGTMLGLLGLLAALPLAYVITPRAAQMINQTIDDLFLRLPAGHLNIAPWEAGLSIVLTLAVSALAALHPALEASRASPREALAMFADKPRKGQNSVLSMLGAACLVFSLPFFLLPHWTQAVWPAYLGIFLLFAGAALQSSWLLTLTAKRLGKPLGRLATSARLACHVIRQSSLRTSIAVGGLVTALALFVALSVMIHSFQTTFMVWVENQISGDIFVTSINAETNQYRDPLPEAARIWIQERAADTGAQVLPYQIIYINNAGLPYQFELMDLQAFSETGGFLFKHGDPEQALQAAQVGQGVLVSETWATRRSKSLGDYFQANIQGIRIHKPIVGIVRDYRTRGGVVYQDRRSFIDLGGSRDWSGARLFFPGADDPQSKAAAFQGELAAQPFAPGLDITSGVGLRKLVTDIFTQTFSITALLMGITLTVAGVGAATILTIRVLERRKELNTLRALGGSRGLIRSMIFWEAAILTVVGAALGLACGFLLSVVFIEVINKQGFGWTFVYAVNWKELGLALSGLLAAALVAAMPAVAVALKDQPAAALKED